MPETEEERTADPPSPTWDGKGGTNRFDCATGCTRPAWHYGDCLVVFVE